MKYIYTLSLATLLWLCACKETGNSGESVQSVPDEAQEKQALLSVLNRWKDAYLTRDTVAIDEIQADEWVYSGSASGAIVTKAESISSFAASKSKYESIEYKDLQVRVYGNTGIITGSETLHVRHPDTLQVYNLRFTDVYVKKEGNWQAVATHTSPITQ